MCCKIATPEVAREGRREGAKRDEVRQTFLAILYFRSPSIFTPYVISHKSLKGLDSDPMVERRLVEQFSESKNKN